MHLCTVLSFAIDSGYSVSQRGLAMHTLMFLTSEEKGEEARKAWVEIGRVVEKNARRHECNDKVFRAFILRCPFEDLNRDLCEKVLSSDAISDLEKVCGEMSSRARLYALSIIAAAAWFLDEDRVSELCGLSYDDPAEETFLSLYLDRKAVTLDV
ncbi:hypothetical protein JXR01_02290 [Candidatus Kaiserbacteria bacterium]|nr:MAG: hypothetical protein JXR01_02290 [Candidatus Kaiserbacteria bacterium]